MSVQRTNRSRLRQIWREAAEPWGVFQRKKGVVLCWRRTSAWFHTSQSVKPSVMRLPSILKSSKNVCRTLELVRTEAKALDDEVDEAAPRLPRSPRGWRVDSSAGGGGGSKTRTWQVPANLGGGMEDSSLLFWENQEWCGCSF